MSDVTKLITVTDSESYDHYNTLKLASVRVSNAVIVVDTVRVAFAIRKTVPTPITARLSRCNFRTSQPLAVKTAQMRLVEGASLGNGG